MALAFFLARAGAKVTIFEEKNALGGVVRNVIPEFRIACDAIDRDAEMLAKLGVQIVRNTRAETAQTLLENGFTHVALCCGAQSRGKLNIPGETNAIAFLEQAKRYPDTLEIGAHIVVAGAGNTAMKALIVSDCGAYASLSGPVIQRACTHAGGPYHYQNVNITGLSVYTNNIPGGAFRGFGVTQSCFAGEMNLDLLAEKAGISPWDIRYRNAIRPGETLPNGQIAGKDTAYAECLLAVKEAYESSPYAGIAGAMKNSGLGVGVPDVGRVAIEVRGGIAHVRRTGRSPPVPRQCPAGWIESVLPSSSYGERSPETDLQNLAFRYAPFKRFLGSIQLS